VQISATQINGSGQNRPLGRVISLLQHKRSSFARSLVLVSTSARSESPATSPKVFANEFSDSQLIYIIAGFKKQEHGLKLR